MKRRAIILFVLSVVLSAPAGADDRTLNPARDILVTLNDKDATVFSSGISAPYRKRKRYAIGLDTRRQAADIADEYALVEVDRWPIRSLSVICFVYRVDADTDRDLVIERMRADVRIESAQPLQQFETLASATARYDDTYTRLQRGLDIMDVPAAHQYSRGQGIRIAIVDSHADTNHEDLKGRVAKMRSFTNGNGLRYAGHGTAVASIIGATANNAKGIVGVAPESLMELYVACWAESGAVNAVCDSFTLAKALDEIIHSAPDVLNLSLIGPYDSLLARLLNQVDRAGIVAVAARSAEDRTDQHFPASLSRVISVGSSDSHPAATPIALGESQTQAGVFAPGEQIMVALPDNAYDFRSGSSLAAAHVSGVTALLLALAPKLPFETVQMYLQASQQYSRVESPVVNACAVLRRADASIACP